MYHISRKGEPAICTAEKGKCPLGGPSGSEKHFETKDEVYAQIAADNMAKSGGMFKTFSADSETISRLFGDAVPGMIFSTDETVNPEKVRTVGISDETQKYVISISQVPLKPSSVKQIFGEDLIELSA